jgi:hypothetical protein
MSEVFSGLPPPKLLGAAEAALDRKSRACWLAVDGTKQKGRVASEKGLGRVQLLGLLCCGGSGASEGAGAAVGAATMCKHWWQLSMRRLSERMLNEEIMDAFGGLKAEWRV